MAKKITKNINSQFYPQFIGSYPVFGCGGRMKGCGGKMSMGGNILSGAGSGAATGTAVLPGWGTAAGAVIGGLTGLLQGKAEQAAQAEEAQQQQLALNAEMVKNLPAHHNYLPTFASGGGIHIAPSKRGTFTAAATKHGMGVQAFASRVLSNKGNYSPAMVKKANFARNAAKWHAGGGFTNDINGIAVTPDTVDYVNEGFEPNKRRLSSRNLDRYNQFDEHILAAGDSTGVDPGLIKSMMLAETGMRPVKNSLGYEGYAQTNQDAINTINKVYGTNYTLEQMYDPKIAPQYVGHYVKRLQDNYGAKTPEEIAVGYNWGPGNIRKFRETGRMPNETQIYSKIINSLVPQKTTDYYNTNQAGIINAGPYTGLTESEAAELNSLQQQDYRKTVAKKKPDLGQTVREGTAKFARKYMAPAAVGMSAGLALPGLLASTPVLGFPAMTTALPAAADYLSNDIGIIHRGPEGLSLEPKTTNKAYGGNIKSRVNYFANGGTHEESPHGGIPVGQDALVEEGEYMFTRKNGEKYIFSNRF